MKYLKLVEVGSGVIEVLEIGSGYMYVSSGWLVYDENDSNDVLLKLPLIRLSRLWYSGTNVAIETGCWHLCN